MLKHVFRVVQPKPRMWVGDGLPVHNIMDADGLGARLNPFIMLDYGAPFQFSPYKEARGAQMHPHRGFETVTFVYQGEITHTDSVGNSGTIYPGDIQWMTAGSGVEHSEMHSDNFTKSGGTMERLQLWINLPEKDKNVKAKYQTIRSRDISRVDLGSGSSMAIIAGEYDGNTGPATTFTPMNIFDLKLKQGSTVRLRSPAGWLCAAFVRTGLVHVNTARVPDMSMAVLDRPDQDVEIIAEKDSDVLFMAGEPIDEPMVAYGPIVVNTRQGLAKVIKDFKQGKYVAED